MVISGSLNFVSRSSIEEVWVIPLALAVMSICGSAFHSFHFIYNHSIYHLPFSFTSTLYWPFMNYSRLFCFKIQHIKVILGSVLCFSHGHPIPTTTPSINNSQHHNTVQTRGSHSLYPLSITCEQRVFNSTQRIIIIHTIHPLHVYMIIQLPWHEVMINSLRLHFSA